MPSTLATHAVDRSTFVVSASFLDEAGTATVPTTLTWTLTTDENVVINSRSAVSITPASSVNIVLSGNDLRYADGARRVLTIEGTYTSSLGSGLPIRDQVTFQIDDLLTVT